MSGLIITLLVVLIFTVLYQLGKASELNAAIKGNQNAQKFNNYMAYALVAFYIVFMVGIYWCHQYFADKMLPESASEHGVEYDSMFIVTLIVTGAIFLLTQFLLFYFILKYKSSDKRTPYFFAHSNKLEMIWTVIPAIAMAVLVVIGLKNWFTMTGDAPKNSQIVEITGKQFNWITRYPGKDGILGKKDYKLINEQNNILGIDWNDPHSKDDVVLPTGELHIQKGKPVQLVINSRDVIHDVGLPHFRMKMDAVPGITTTMWFTPTITTEEMKTKTQNPNFVYEISCDQMCGRGHYSMRGVVIVEDEAGHKAWDAKQQSYFAQNNATSDSTATAPAKDSASKPMAMSTH